MRSWHFKVWISMAGRRFCWLELHPCQNECKFRHQFLEIKGSVLSNSMQACKERKDRNRVKTNVDKGRQMHEIDATTLIAKDSEGWFSNSAVFHQDKLHFSSNISDRTWCLCKAKLVNSKHDLKKEHCYGWKKTSLSKKYFSCFESHLTQTPL